MQWTHPAATWKAALHRSQHAESQDEIYSHVKFEFITHRWVKYRWSLCEELFSLKAKRRILERFPEHKPKQSSLYRK